TIFPAWRPGKIKSRPVEGKIGAVKWIAQQLDAPFLLHVSSFAKKLFLLSKRGRMAARRGFAMNQVRVRRPDNLKSPFSKFEAKIDIIETDPQITLIESPRFLKDAFADEDARGRKRRIILLKPGTVEIAGVTARNTAVSNICNATQAENHAAMLER